MSTGTQRVGAGRLGFLTPRQKALALRVLRPAPFGMLLRRRTTSTQWGFDRGTPLDRHFIEGFLAANRDAIRGRVLEVKDDTYTRRYGTDVEAAEHSVATARSGYYPTVGLRASYGKAIPGLFDNPSFFGNNDANTSVGLTLNIPIFSGFATSSNVRSALAQRDIARDQLEQQRRALERNTRDAYQGLVAGISEVEARRLALVSAQSAYDASQDDAFDALFDRRLVIPELRERFDHPGAQLFNLVADFQTIHVRLLDSANGLAVTLAQRVRTRRADVDAGEFFEHVQVARIFVVKFLERGFSRRKLAPLDLARGQLAREDVMEAPPAALRSLLKQPDRMVALAHPPVEVGGFCQHAVIGRIPFDQAPDHRRCGVLPPGSSGAPRSKAGSSP